MAKQKSDHPFNQPKASPKVNYAKRGRFVATKRILEATGENVWDARIKARELTRLPTTTELGINPKSEK